MNTTAAGAIDEAEEATDSEVTRYEKAFRETRRVLDESIEALMVLEEFENDSDRRDQLALKRLEVETSRSDLVRANIAFHTGKATMAPPSRELVSQILELSKRAVELTVERATASAILKIATSALNKFAEIQKIGAG